MKRQKFLKLDILADDSDPARDSGHISWIQRLKVRNEYEGGSFSRPYHLDIVTHKGVDAVGILPWWRKDGEIQVMLLRSFRPAQMFRPVDPREDPFLVEIIAGVLEEGEHDRKGVRRRAALETLEEAGIRVAEEDLEFLGQPFFSSPGLYTEKLWLCAIEVDPEIEREAILDGSVMEELIETFTLPLSEARSRCLDGGIVDAKTEIALERFARLHGGGVET